MNGRPYTMKANPEDDYTNDGLQYHLKLMYDTGFIDGKDISTADGPDFLIRRLTWTGHDFLDAARTKRSGNLHPKEQTKRQRP